MTSKIIKFGDFFLDTSILPNAGLGLFTGRDLEPHEIVSEYTGKIYARQSDIPNNGDYVFELNSRNYIDALDDDQCFAKYANDANGYIKMRGVMNNCYFEIKPRMKKVYLKASRKIQAGEELFVSYGNDYWRNVAQEQKAIRRSDQLSRLEKFSGSGMQ